MPEPARAGFLAQALAIAGKDLRIEWRSREIVYTTAFMAALIVLIFAFAFMSGPESASAPVTAGADPGTVRVEIVFGPGVVAGVLWVALLFSGVVALSRTFDRERENEAIRSLLLSPVPRAAIYVGKLLATVALMVLVMLVVVPLCGLLFSNAMAAHLGMLALILLLGILGFAAAGVVFSAALLRSRNRDSLLSTLLFPVLIPIFLAGAKATAQLLDPGLADGGNVGFWLQFLLVADLLFVITGLWSFEPVVGGD